MKRKQNKQITIHLDDELYDAIVQLSAMSDKTLSDWGRDVFKREVRAIYIEAKHTADRLAMLENYEFCESSESSENSED